MALVFASNHGRTGSFVIGGLQQTKLFFMKTGAFQISATFIYPIFFSFKRNVNNFKEVSIFFVAYVVCELKLNLWRNAFHLQNKVSIV